jgi:hypothetical protein
VASDFEFTGIENDQAGFRESSSGMQHWASVDHGSSVELLDGDQAEITSGGQRVVWSIREQRVVGYA